MSKTDGLDILVQVNYLLDNENKDEFENGILSALPINVDLKVKLAELKEGYKNLQDRNIRDKISDGMVFLQYGIKKTRIPEKVFMKEDNGDKREVLLSDVIDFNDKYDKKDMLLLGTFYLLILDIDHERILNIPQEILFPFVNSMRNRPYDKYRDIIDVAMYGNIMESLDLYLKDNPDDQYHKSTDKIKIILNALSKQVKELPSNFASEEEKILFAESFIETDVKKRIGDTYFKSKTV